MTAFQAFQQDFKNSESKKIYDSNGKLVKRAVLPHEIMYLTKLFKLVNISEREMLSK